MKKFYLLFVLTSIFGCNIFAMNNIVIKVIATNECGQSYAWTFSDAWNIAGNALSTGNEWMGSSNNYHVNFKVNSTPIMRLHTNGNVGVGDYTSFIPGTQLDVYNHGATQLRLTYQNTTVPSTSYIWTDFLTNSSGDLVISPYNSTTTPTAHYVGINVTPTQMLDVDGNGRFRNIPHATVGNNYSFILAASGGTTDEGTLYRGMDINTIAQNGIMLDQSNLKIELGSTTINDPLASLLHLTYVPMHDYSTGDDNILWWQDDIPGGANLPTYPTIGGRFRIGGKHYLHDAISIPLDWEDAKFTVSNSDSGFNTAAIISNSYNCHKTLSVEHSNWSFASPLNGTSLPAGTLNNIFSHISQGNPCGNIAVHGVIDSALGSTNIGIKGEIMHNPLFYPAQVMVMKNIGGHFMVNYENYNTCDNYGVQAIVSNTRLYGKIPPNNTGIDCQSMVADNVLGMKIFAYDGDSVNTGLYVESLVDAAVNSNRAPDVYGGQFYVSNGLNSNFGVYASAIQAPATSSVNVGFHSDIKNNVQSVKNTGYLSDLQYCYTTPLNEGVLANISDNSNSTYPGTNQSNIGFHGKLINNQLAYANKGCYIEIGNNGGNGNSQTNIGYDGSVSYNNGAAYNAGASIMVSGNNTNNNNPSQLNKGYTTEVATNYKSAQNIGFQAAVNGNNAPNNINNSQLNYGFWGAVNQNDGSGQNYGARLIVSNNNSSNTNSNQNNYGVFTVVDDNSNTNLNYGVFAQSSNPNAVLNVGVAGIAMGSGNGVDTINNNLPTIGNIGVYGFAPDNGNYGSGFVIPNGVAGYFSGAVIHTGNIWNPSDENLKEKVNNADSALFKLSLLNPKTYYFKSDNFPGMALPHTQQYGLLAQDVAKVFPTLVSDFVNPALLDTSGKEIYPSVPFKAINYQAFIPLLIQSVKELKGNNDSLKNKLDNANKTNDSLISRLNKLEEQMNNFASVLNECCKNNKSTGMNNENKTDINSTIKIVTDNSVNGNRTELYQNKPNPFKTITTFTYLLGTAGFVELEITDQYGQLIEKLVNTNQETGNYSIDWDSVKVAPGMYFYSLKVNSLLLVKKAIKVN